MVELVRFVWGTDQWRMRNWKVLLQKAKSKPCNFVVAAEGIKKVALGILSNRAISGKQKQAAKDMAGGAKIHVGVVEGGSGRGLVFTVAGRCLAPQM